MTTFRSKKNPHAYRSAQRERRSKARAAAAIALRLAGTPYTGNRMHLGLANTGHIHRRAATGNGVGHVAGRWIPAGMQWCNGVLRAAQAEVRVVGRCWFGKKEVTADGALAYGAAHR